MILSPKWQQTYEEALQAMKDTTYSQYSLADVSTHHHTEELLEAALRNNRCSLRDIPVEKRTLRLCHVALECIRRWRVAAGAVASGHSAA